MDNQNSMRKSASEIIRDLERRIARLEDSLDLKDIDVKRKCLSSGTYGTGMPSG